MTRKVENLRREDFLAACPPELVDQLVAELCEWEGGDTAPVVQVTTDSLGRIDSQSDPSPGEPTMEMVAAVLGRSCGAEAHADDVWIEPGENATDAGGWINMVVEWSDGTKVLTGAWLHDKAGGVDSRHLPQCPGPFLIEIYGQHEDCCGVELSSNLQRLAGQEVEAVERMVWQKTVDELEGIDEAWRTAVRQYLVQRLADAPLDELLWANACIY